MSVRILFVFFVTFCAVRAAEPGIKLEKSWTEPKDGEKFFGLARQHEVRISLADAEWISLQGSGARGFGQPGTDFKDATGRLIHVGSGFGMNFPWAHADVVLDGEKFKDVGLRYRGNGSFMRSSALAPFRANWKIKIDLFGTKGSWAGLKTINFNAGTVDTTLTHEALAFAIFRAAGVPASRTAYSSFRFTVPGRYDNASGGPPYVLIEDVNKAFLREALPPGTGLLMKPEGTRGGITSLGNIWSAYVRTFRPERDATPHEQQRVMEFAQLISQSDVALFRSKIGTYLDVEEFLRFIAVNAFIGSSDSYLGGGHNFYVYLDPKDDKFRFIPWDEDGSLRGAVFDLMAPYRGDQPLIYWLLDDPAVKAKYRAILIELSKTAFSLEALRKMCEDVEKVTGLGTAPTLFLESRVDTLQRLIASWAL